MPPIGRWTMVITLDYNVGVIFRERFLSHWEGTINAETAQPE